MRSLASLAVEKDRAGLRWKNRKGRKETQRESLANLSLFILKNKNLEMDSEYSLIKPDVQTGVCLETDAPISCAGGADRFASRKKQSQKGQAAGEALHMKYFIGCLAMILIFASCETTSFSPAEDDRFVVQAYLYAGELVTDIRLTATLPLGSEDSTAPPIIDADVALIKNGEHYALVPSPGDSGYYHYPGDDLVIETGDVFDFEATVAGVTANARTTTPLPPDEISLSPTELVVEGRGTEPVIVQWPNPKRDWHFITYQNIEPDSEPIFEGTVFGQRRVITEPTDAESIEIPVRQMTHYGRYEVRVYRVSEEYVQLYMSREQDTRDLNEPETNIENGLGIFTAFSSRTAYFEVVR